MAPYTCLIPTLPHCLGRLWNKLFLLKQALVCSLSCCLETLSPECTESSLCGIPARRAGPWLTELPPYRGQGALALLHGPQSPPAQAPSNIQGCQGTELGEVECRCLLFPQPPWSSGSAPGTFLCTCPARHSHASLPPLKEGDSLGLFSRALPQGGVSPTGEPVPNPAWQALQGSELLIMNLIKGEQEPQSDLGFSL